MIRDKVIDMNRTSWLSSPDDYYLMLMFREQQTSKRRIQFLRPDETKYIILNQFMKCEKSMYIYNNLKYQYQNRYLYYYSQPVPKQYELVSMNM